MVVKSELVYKDLERIASYEGVIGLVLYKQKQPSVLIITEQLAGQERKLGIQSQHLLITILSLEEFLARVMDRDKDLLNILKAGLIVYDIKGVLKSVHSLIKQGFMPGFNETELNIYNEILQRFQEVKRFKEQALINAYSATMDVLGALMYFLGETVVIPKKAEQLFKKHLITQGIIGAEYYKKFKYIYKLFKNFEKGKKKVITGVDIDNALKYALELHEQVDQIIRKKLDIT